MFYLMKQLIITAILFLGLGTIAQAQLTVPVAISNQFAKQYPTANDIDWDQDDENNFIAYFTIGDNFAHAIFSEKGAWLKTSTFLDESALPSSISTALKKAYADGFYNDVEKIETSEKTVYKIEFETDTEVLLFLFDNEGKMISKEQKEE